MSHMGRVLLLVSKVTTRLNDESGVVRGRTIPLVCAFVDFDSVSFEGIWGIRVEDGDGDWGMFDGGTLPSRAWCCTIGKLATFRPVFAKSNQTKHPR